MTRRWTGFVAQNQVVKAQWAAMEEREVKVAVQTFDKLLGKRARSRTAVDQPKASSWNCLAEGLEKQ